MYVVTYIYTCLYDTIRYDTIVCIYYLTVKKLTGSQLSLPHCMRKFPVVVVVDDVVVAV